MNYFTSEWCHGDTDEAEHQAISEKYQKHLALLLPPCPPDVQTLASNISLHDGIIRECSWKAHEATLFLRLRCGNNQVGYFDLNLHYFGVLFSPLDLSNLLTLNANKNSNALSDEMDEEDGLFVHRILFIKSRRVKRSRRFRASRSVRISRRGMIPRVKRRFRYYETVIRFQHLRLVITPRKSRFDASE